MTENYNKGRDLYRLVPPNEWFGRFREFLQVLNQYNLNKKYPLHSSLEYRPKDKSKFQKKPKCIGLDTETYASNGNILCLCTSSTDQYLTGTPDKSPSIREIFNFLYKYKGKGGNYFAWNLKFDANAILKCLPDDQLVKFYYGTDEEEIDEAHRFKIDYDNIKITYLKKKMLEMRDDSKHKIVIYDAMQYFIGAGTQKTSKLDDVAHAYLGEQKEYDGKYQDKKFPDNLESVEMQKIVDYCIKDCQLTANLMSIWLDKFYDNFGYYPQKFYSAGYISKEHLSMNMLTFPSFRKIPYPVQVMAYRCYWGGRFEIMEKGTLKDIYHYDINSAYPYAMTQIPDFRYGKWVKVTSLDQIKDDDWTTAGYYQIYVTVDETRVAPFPARDSKWNVFFPNGLFTTFITHAELKMALQYYNVQIHRINGYKFIPDYQGKSEFGNLIQEMYNARLRQTNEGQKYVYKVLINSMYGKFAQHVPTPRGLFNPSFAAYITGICRAMLLRAMGDAKDSIVMCATDGVFSRKPLPFCEKVTGKKVLGEWEAEFHPNFKLIMAGLYSYNTSNNFNMKCKTRGFPSSIFLSEEENSQEQFDLDDSRVEYDRETGRYVIRFYTQQPIGLAQGIIQKEVAIRDICKFTFISREIDLNGDTKRNWFKDLTNLTSDVCRSIPMEITQPIQKL